MELTINITEENKLDFFIQLIKKLSYAEIINPPLSYLNKIKEDVDVLKAKEYIVAYTIEGKPLNNDEYINEILKAEKEIEDGIFITHEDLKKDIEGWHK